MSKGITEEEIEKYPLDMQAKIWMRESLSHTEDDIIQLENMIEANKISPENVRLILKTIRILKQKARALLEAIKKTERITPKCLISRRKATNPLIIFPHIAYA